MRVGIIRGDLPGSVYVADLEPVSQYDAAIEPPGQTRYLTRPNLTLVGAALSAYAPASILGTGNVTLPVTINAGNQTLKVKTSAAAAFTSVLVATGAYSTVAALAAAATTALAAAGLSAEMIVSPVNSARVALRSTTKGPGAYIAVDSTAGGSTFNTPSVLPVGGGNHTVPATSAVITALGPVGGPFDVSAATIRSTVSPGLTSSEVDHIADTIAPKFYETDVAIKSYLVGNLKNLRSASYNPDPNRLPALVSGAAITVLQDDGVTVFSATVPTLTNAQVNTPGLGQLTLTGTNIANPELDNTLKVRFAGAVSRVLSQSQILAAGGTITTTSIVIPASLSTGVAASTTTAQVQFTSLVSNIFTFV